MHAGIKRISRQLTWLTALGAVLVVVGVLWGANNPPAINTSFILISGGASVPTLWSVLRVMWNKEDGQHLHENAYMRLLIVPLLTAPVMTLVGLITVLLPPVAKAIAVADQRSTDGHELFPLQEHSAVFYVIMLAGLIGAFVAMLLGLLVWVSVLIPFSAFFRPADYANELILDSSPERAKERATEGRATSVLMILVFLIPTLIVVGARKASAGSLQDALGNALHVFGDFQYYWGDAAWILGIALIPLGIAAIVVVKKKQAPVAVFLEPPEGWAAYEESLDPAQWLTEEELTEGNQAKPTKEPLEKDPWTIIGDD